MKKILATLSIIFCLAFAITGLGGCSGCSSTDEAFEGFGRRREFLSYEDV